MIMNRFMQRRLTRLEAGAGVGADKPDVLAVRFVGAEGKFGGEICPADRAEAGECVWHRQPHEAQKKFQRRVTAELRKKQPNRFAVVIFWPAKDRASGEPRQEPTH